MTEREFQVWTARFARVWCGADESAHGDSAYGESALSEDGHWQWSTSLGAGIEVEITVIRPGDVKIDLQYHPPGIYRRCGQLQCTEDGIDLGHGMGKLHCAEEEFALFATQWLPLFRPNCWLSGCAIEASAHEKIEWMQKVTPEEIQAWNLDM